MNKKFDQATKQKIIRQHLEDGRTVNSLMSEYGMSRPSFYNWLKQYREECQNSPELQKEFDSFQETLKLRKELEELKKENEFLKKAAAFFAKEIH